MPAQILAFALIVTCSSLLTLAGAAKFVTPIRTVELVNALVRGRVRITTNAVRLFASLELAAGGALLVPALRRQASLLTLLLGATMLVAVATALRRGVALPCGCYGALRPNEHLGVRNLLAVIGLCVASFYILFADTPLHDSLLAALSLSGSVGAAAVLCYLQVRSVRNTSGTKAPANDYPLEESAVEHPLENAK